MTPGTAKIIMVVQTTDRLHSLAANQLSLFSQKLHNSIENSLEKHNGVIRHFNDKQYVVNFNSATDAVLCALKIQHKFKYSTPKVNTEINELHIALTPNDDDGYDNELFSTFICHTIEGSIIVTYQIQNLYETENKNIKIDKERIRILKKSETTFLINLMLFLEANWKNPYLRISHLEQPLNYSSSQIYNKIKSLSNKSPSAFIRDFRLNKAMGLIHKNRGNINAIAKSSGFKSIGYFSKMFKHRFGILPSKYNR